MNKILILDFGSQYTQLITRRIRELNVFSEVRPCNLSLDDYDLKDLKGIILSGGPSSVVDENAPPFDSKWLEQGVPILGVCYGMQLIANIHGAEIKSGDKREYGLAKLNILKNDSLFFGLSGEDKESVWMSHGDHVDSAPEGFSIIANSDSLPVAAFENVEKQIYGIQFHPEVAHTKCGKKIISNFVFNIARCEANWTSSNFVDLAIEKIKAQVVEGQKVICGLSGGVDSTVAAVLVNKAIDNNLICIFVDNGLLRQNEGEQVEKMLGEKGYGLNVIKIDAADRFLDALKGISDPEQKRKIIGKVFIDVFEEEANKIKDVSYLVQGTLYPDIIESVSVRGPSATIKSHHNVGGLPEKMNLELIEPFKELFKDEVRELGRKMDIPEEFISRQPFPGPGLAVRCLGDISEDRLKMLRAADYIFQEEVKKANLYKTLWQSFAVLLPVKSVGVMGDNRTYEETIALRAVTSEDGMTADWYFLPEDLLRTTSNRIINEVHGVNRVTLDISSKPPATIEWE